MPYPFSERVTPRVTTPRAEPGPSRHDPGDGELLARARKVSVGGETGRLVTVPRPIVEAERTLIVAGVPLPAEPGFTDGDPVEDRREPGRARRSPTARASNPGKGHSGKSNATNPAGVSTYASLPSTRGRVLASCGNAAHCIGGR